MKGKSKRFVLTLAIILSQIVIIFFVVCVGYTAAINQRIKAYEEDCRRDYAAIGDHVYVNDFPLKEAREMYCVIESSIDNYPENARNVLSDWIIVFSSSLPPRIQKSFTGTILNDAAAMTIPVFHTIIVFTDDLDTLEYAMPHELGHALAYEYEDIDTSEEFTSIYNRYKDTYTENSPLSVREYITSSPSEFFASCASTYSSNQKHLQTVAPDAYVFIDSLFENTPYDNFIDESISQTRSSIRRLRDELAQKSPQNIFS